MRLRFTTRDLLWLIVVFALALGWWLDRSHVAAQLDRTGRTLRGYQFELEQYRPRTAEPE
jgi:hypothetical protein